MMDDKANDWRQADDEWRHIEMIATSSDEHPLPISGDEKEAKEQFSTLQPISFAECWAALKVRNLDAERKKVQSTNDVNSSRPFCCCLRCQTSLNRQLENEKETILALTKVPFDNEDNVHNRMLATFYTKLKPKCNVPKRYGAHWEVVGFQGDDPATDLRGAGIFGLLQLLNFVSDPSSRSQALTIFHLSEDTIQNFPFAIVGLNFTKLSLQALRRGKLNKIANRENDVLLAVNTLYAGIFCYFYKIWTKEPKKTIENFGFVLQQIEKSLKRKCANIAKTRIKSTETNQLALEPEQIEFDMI